MVFQIVTVLDLTLHAASKTGPRIATMLRTGWSRLFNVTLLKDGFTTEITWDVHGAEQHFLGRDGKKMMWKNDHLALNGDWLVRLLLHVSYSGLD